MYIHSKERVKMQDEKITIESLLELAKTIAKGCYLDDDKSTPLITLIEIAYKLGRQEASDNS